MSYAFATITAPETVMVEGVAVEVPRSLDAVSVVERSAATGTVAAAAASVAGGDSDDVRKAFAMGVTTSLAAEAYLATAHQDPNPSPSSKPPYCKDAVPGLECSAPADAWTTDPDTGELVVDVGRTDSNAQHVGLEGTAQDVRGFYIREGQTAALIEQTIKNPGSEGSLIMACASKAPGVNAGAFFHDQWATDWNMPPVILQGTIPPGMIMTSVATGVPLVIQIAEVAADSEKH